MARGFLIESSGSLGDSIRSFCERLLKDGVLDVLLIPIDVNGFVFPGFVTGVEGVRYVKALSPYMPVNTAGILQKLTRISPPSKKLGVFLRPCEARAVVELVKLNQINLENIFVFSMDCLGTVDFEGYRKLVEDGADPEDPSIVFNYGLRDACKCCLHPVSPWADVRICFIGLNGSIAVEICSGKGEELFKDIGDLDFTSRENVLKNLINERISEERKLLEYQRKELRGHEKIIEILSPCIGCKNCMSVCPICYCRECFFNSTNFDMDADRYLSLAKSYGVLKMPSDTLLFHLTRMLHVAPSCVACGMCQEACPQNIPIFALFKATSKRVQDLFDYEPGRSVEEEIPVRTFQEDEFAHIQSSISK